MLFSKSFSNGSSWSIYGINKYRRIISITMGITIVSPPPVEYGGIPLLVICEGEPPCMGSSVERRL